MNRCVVRLTTSYWTDNRSVHFKKQLTILKRKSEGYQILMEDCNNMGAEEVIPNIVNLHEVPDGIYIIRVSSVEKDYQTGLIEDYDYELVEYKE